MAGKKQQARPALKNKPKNQKQQQNHRYHQPQAHKERLKDQKQPIIYPQPAVQIILKTNPQQFVYKQAPRAIPKDFVKQQQAASKQTVQKQAPRALPKDFVKQQQATKKSREKPIQLIKIVNKQQKYADKRRRHYQIKSQQKQLEKEFRGQKFNMEMMEQEQLQARLQRFESGLLPQERDILIRNRLEIQWINQQYSDRNVYNFGNDNQQFILLTKPVRYDLLSQVIEDKRETFKDEEIEYAVGNQQTAVTVTFFNNNITSPEDCDAFIERVYQHENGRLFKCRFDFGTVIQRSEVIIDPNYVGRDMIEALYPGRTTYKLYKTTALSKYRTPMDVEQDFVSNKQITYIIRLSDENLVQNPAPTILYSRKSINEFKQYVRSSIIQMQERTEMIDTKEFMVAIYSMEVISYRIPFPGKNVEEFIKIHKNKKNIIKYIHSDDDYNICFCDNLTGITMSDSKGIEIDRHSRIAEGKRLLFEFYNIMKENQREFHKNYPGFNWDDSLKICQKFYININCYKFDDKNVEDPNNNSKRKMDTHIKECQQNNGQIKKYFTLEKFAKPFFPYITSNKTYRKIRRYQYPILTPTAVTSTIKAKNYIKTISYDNSQQDFVEKWLDQVFSEALYICDDNKFADDVPQLYEVHVIGFNQVYDSLRNDMIAGKSFVNHRENIAGKTQIHKFKVQDDQISENCFIVQLEKKRCSCSTPLQVAYFTMDNSKYFYLNTYYNFLTLCLDMNYVHVIYGDTDSLCLAVAHESWPIKDKKQ
ncbi:MAG: hypothetical protein EZS28_021821 [Streblomastix strix]|uniref:DNA-directed DNA polymerase n=1 Tax=Streblomastix strix TaxID=222440 RepID=A0A5J4VJ75_9EUKA|nr:MAG: hypothetical protein EZS28_021821 [Streblomastix strix]